VRLGIPILLSRQDRAESLASAERAGAGEDGPLDLDPAWLEARPLGLTGGVTAVRQLARELSRAAAARLRGRGRGSGQRVQSHVKAEYELPSVDYYADLSRCRPMIHRGSLRWASSAAFRQQLVETVLETARRLGAKRVLEVGFGDGVNVWLMNRLHPDLELELFGFDYSFHRAALASHRLRPGDCRGYFNGDAKNIALQDQSFDLVYTSYCLEQLAYDLPQVLAEIARVGRHALLIEPFLGVQNVWGRLHGYRCDYPEDIPAAARAAGLQPLALRRLGAGKIFNQAGALLARSSAA
jgi:SAM-dependent methyltransferase